MGKRKNTILKLSFLTDNNKTHSKYVKVFQVSYNHVRFRFDLSTTNQIISLKIMRSWLHFS